MVSPIYIFTFCLSFYSCNIAVAKQITIDRYQGFNTEGCLDGTSSCKTLDFVFANGSRNLNNTVIKLMRGTHLLVYSSNFRFIHNFTLTSNADAVISCSTTNIGINFEFARDLRFISIGMRNCGVGYRWPGTKENQTTTSFIRIAVRFVFSRNIHIENTNFTRNKGIAVAMFDVTGIIEIVSVQFIQNCDTSICCVDENKMESGGGVYIEYINSSDETNLSEYDNGATYVISNSVFIENMFDKGAGLSIRFFGNSRNNIVNIENCLFDSNMALWGGGFYVSHEDKSQNNSVHVFGSVFQNNHAKFGGGGVRRYSVYQLEEIGVDLPNKLSFTNVSFKNNSAMWGGGISISGPTRLIYSRNETYRDIHITNCTFLRNKATVGFALGFATTNLNKDVIGPSISYKVKITNSSFNKNYMQLTEDDQVIGQGTIYSEEITLVFIGHNDFVENNYTAIVLDSSSLIVTSRSVAVFLNNTGLEGGALALYGSSSILLQPKSYIKFENNIARRKGGAMYVKSGGPPRIGFQTTQLQTSRCFLRYDSQQKLKPDEWNVKIEFLNNAAPIASGNAIYASTLQHCRQPNERRVNPAALKWRCITYENSNNQSEVVTNAIDINIDQSQWMNVQPNIPFSPEVLMRDEKNQSVYGSVKIEILKKGVTLDPPNNIFLIRNKISRLRLNGKPGKDPFSFRLLTTSGQMVDTENFDGTLGNCPLGFEPNAAGTKCVCMNDEISGVVRCLENGTVYILKGQWGFTTKKTKMLQTIICPIHYCNCYNEEDGYLCELDTNRQCAKGRTGRLCSQCEPGLSVQLGNEECKKCSDIWLLLLIPMFLLLCSLVMVIMYFNIDAFSGYLNAYLYSYQMVMLLIPENVQLDRFISFVIGVTSVQGTGGSFGICLFNGMDNLQKLAINYVAPSAMIFFTFIMGLVIPQNLWQKLFYRQTSEVERDYRRKSFGRALSFVLVVCYSTFTGVTLKLLHWVNIDGDLVLYEAAFIGYFEEEHVFYGVLAILVLLFIVLLFPIVLLFTPFFTYRFIIIQRVQPILNALKNCFKDENVYRMFAAFYFICRFILLVIAVFIQEEVTRLIVLSIACVVFQAVFSSVQPYEKWTYNFWDILLLTNMCIISLLSLILSVPFTTSKLVRKRNIYLLQTLVYIPLITIVLRLLSYAYNRFKLNGDVTDGGPTKRGSILQRLLQLRNSFKTKQRRNAPYPRRAMEMDADEKEEEDSNQVV